MPAVEPRPCKLRIATVPKALVSKKHDPRPRKHRRRSSLQPAFHRAFSVKGRVLLRYLSFPSPSRRPPTEHPSTLRIDAPGIRPSGTASHPRPDLECTPADICRLTELTPFVVFAILRAGSVPIRRCGGRPYVDLGQFLAALRRLRAAGFVVRTDPKNRVAPETRSGVNFPTAKAGGFPAQCGTEARPLPCGLLSSSKDSVTGAT